MLDKICAIQHEQQVVYIQLDIKDKSYTMIIIFKKNSTTTLGSSSQGGPSHSAVLTLTSLPE